MRDVVTLAGYEPSETPFMDDEDEAETQLTDEFAEQLFDQHELLFANAERSVLLVPQGLDCSGENGTIKHVVITMNPAGVGLGDSGTSTKRPTELRSAQPRRITLRGW